MADEDQPPVDFFPLDTLSVQMQLGMYEYLNAWTLNEVRKVDKLRRRLVDDNPRLFEKKRMIYEVIVLRRTPNDSLKLKFNDYCKNCKDGRRNNIILHFDIEGAKCTRGTQRCFYRCESARELSHTSPVIGLTLEECCHLVTKGSKLEKLALKGDISKEFVQSVRHLLDASPDLYLKIYGFESTELFMKLVQEPRMLKLFFRTSGFWLLNDEFFRFAGRCSLSIDCDRDCSVPLTDEQLSILVERGDLTDINIENQVDGITSEGVKRAIQNLLHSSPKRVKMTIPHDLIYNSGSLKEIPEFDGDSDDGYEYRGFYLYHLHQYTYGGGKVEVIINFRLDLCKIQMSRH